jgi:hypothetical protein
MNGKTVKTIELTWECSGPCPGQWYAYFHNEHDNKTYCVYIREDSYWWSADILYADGRYSSGDFKKLPSETVERECIELAFDYLSGYMTSRTEAGYFSIIVEEIILYLNHRFPYFHFDSQERKNFDFIGETAKGDKESRMEVLLRRAKLMRKYLAEYENFLNSISQAY